MTDDFKKLGLSAQALEVVEEKGFEVPTPIQAMAIPAILSSDLDIVGQAHTGTGKTAAFGFPIIELIKPGAGHAQVLILVPTRELAVQVAEELYSLKGKKKIEIVSIYGGQSIDLQIKRLKRGVDIVVGTPGRITDHLNRKTLKIGAISYLVLDEADEMLNMGFLEDVTDIIKKTPDTKRTLLFSATMPREILDIASKYMREYKTLKVSQDRLTVSQTDQIYFEVLERDKFEALCRIIDVEEGFYALVFCRTKIDVDTLSRRLMERGYDADALHGDMSQKARESILHKFKKKNLNVLVATDVAARGIDIQELSHVINYALPQDPSSYVHRIGRTGRAGKSGAAITFITPQEFRKLDYIRKKAGTEIRKASLPGVKDVIESKKIRIKDRLQDIIKTGISSHYRQLSKELFDGLDSSEAVPALLKYAFGNLFDASSYTEIEDPIYQRSGRVRLFVSQGLEDGLTKNKLMDIIKDKCSINEDVVADIRILDKFSFISLPLQEAERLLAYFKRKSGFRKTKNNDLIMEKARKPQNKKR